MLDATSRRRPFAVSVMRWYIDAVKVVGTRHPVGCVVFLYLKHTNSNDLLARLGFNISVYVVLHRYALKFANNADKEGSFTALTGKIFSNLHCVSKLQTNSTVSICTCCIDTETMTVLKDTEKCFFLISAFFLLELITNVGNLVVNFPFWTCFTTAMSIQKYGPYNSVWDDTLCPCVVNWLQLTVTSTELEELIITRQFL